MNGRRKEGRERKEKTKKESEIEGRLVSRK
jgi:hypothetical protein